MAERRARTKPGSNVYTALTAIALIVLLCGIGYLWYRQYQFTGTYKPFDLKLDTSAVPAEVMPNATAHA